MLVGLKNGLVKEAVHFGASPEQGDQEEILSWLEIKYTCCLSHEIILARTKSYKYTSELAGPKKLINWKIFISIDE